jgi:hypothetical protein
MRLLLDENLPKRLKQDYQEHEVYTVRDKGWNGIRNGELLNCLLKTILMHYFLSIKTCNSNKISLNTQFQSLYYRRPSIVTKYLPHSRQK